MESNVSAMISKARPKITALLRSRKFYSQKEMINQYKTHILCLLETNPGGFYHSLDSVLAPLDRLQTHFLNEMATSESDAFILFNLLPLAARRDIGMLGLIWKCIRGSAHSDLQQLFPRARPVRHAYGTKLQNHRHSFQLEEERPGTHHALLRRSIFGLARIWNRLPREVIAAENVKNFQISLTQMVRGGCSRKIEKWEHVFSPRPKLLRETQFYEELYLYRISSSI